MEVLTLKFREMVIDILLNKNQKDSWHCFGAVLSSILPVWLCSLHWSGPTVVCSGPNRQSSHHPPGC